MKIKDSIKVGFMISDMDIIKNIINKVHVSWQNDGIKFKASGLKPASLIHDAFFIGYFCVGDRTYLRGINRASEHGERYIVRVHKHIDKDVGVIAESLGVFKATVYQYLCGVGLKILLEHYGLYAVLSAGSCHGLKGLESVNVIVDHVKKI